MALHFPSSLEGRPHRGVLAEALEGVSVVVVVVCGRGRGVGGDGVGLGVEVAVPAVGRAGRGREGGEAAAVGVRAVSVGDVAWNEGERERDRGQNFPLDGSFILSCSGKQTPF